MVAGEMPQRPDTEVVDGAVIVEAVGVVAAVEGAAVAVAVVTVSVLAAVGAGLWAVVQAGR
jgi:hypothetical protein